MLIYQDVLTGDEMLSDAFPMYVYTPHNPTFPGADRSVCSKEIGDIAYEVDCANIIIKEGEVDIGRYLSVTPTWQVLTLCVRR